MNLVLAVAAVIAIVAAACSTWSPCGVSMLATVTRWPNAAVAIGTVPPRRGSWPAPWRRATLGLCSALAAALRAAGASAAVSPEWPAAPPPSPRRAGAALGGLHLPPTRRQVNERWLDQFRLWVYGAGFGWQIGTGLATYVKTAAVYLWSSWPP